MTFFLSNVHFQICQVYMYAFMFIKIKFIEAASEKKKIIIIIRYFKSNISILINTFFNKHNVYKHTEPDFW